MSLREFIVAGRHRAWREEESFSLAQQYAQNGLSPKERVADRFVRLCGRQKPVILPDQQIVFMRTSTCMPEIFTENEWDEIKGKHFIHELGFVSNICIDYSAALKNGLLALCEKADELQRREVEALLTLCERYRVHAQEIGRSDVAQALCVVPAQGAKTFRQALQSLRILHFAAWLEGEYHVTLGRFDQYLWPYLKADLEAGVLTQDEAQALLEDFFLSFNIDSDLYPGVQQGDNGQSMVLGGCDENGNDAFNLLSRMCLVASRTLKLIDPKINLRVDKNTPEEIYIEATRLTQAGLGFPQYANDDVVIPALQSMGYDLCDARNYVVAACWEFIIPGKGMDVVNIAALSLPKVVDKLMHKYLPESATFDEFFAHIDEVLTSEIDALIAPIKDLWFIPAPLYSLINGSEKDLSLGAKYNNFGMHGTGLSTAVDALWAIREHVFDKADVSAADLIAAVDADFAQNSELLPRLRNETAKFGQGDEAVDALAQQLLTRFARALAGRTNCRGGIWRAGTGSAMYYLWHANEMGASADGRRKGEPFAANYSPTLFAKVGGPLSVITSFTRPDLSCAMNGGPLTLEFDGNVFRSEDSLAKVAALVRTFILLGGHQLQLNAVDAAAMRDAQIHPEDHRQLIVRVWGWSAYFVQLEKPYQDHVIARQEHAV